MFSEYSKFIVTGANGWLGSRIILALTEGIKKLGPLELGDKSVRCILRPGENASKLLNLGVEVHYGDILDIGSCKRFLRDSEHSLIIHTGDCL